ncbi:MAG: cytochrome P450 [Chloroflexi bacterium]|nr:cytochrome P450 [Chloroflexota bacterium]
MAIQVNPFAPEFIEDPYPTFRILHKEAPVFWNDALNFWMLTKYDDVVAAAKGHPDFSSIEGPASGFMQAQEGQEGQEAQKTGRSIIISDPPLHTRLRRLVGQAFTAKSISEMESRMRKITGELLDGLLCAPRTGLDTLW